MIHQKLKELREKQSVSPIELAERLNISYQSIWRFEAGKSNWNEAKLAAYARELGYKIESNYKFIKLF